MDLQEYIFKLKNLPENVSFEDTVFIIDKYYIFKPTEFKNAEILNNKDENNWSCKIFAFGLLNKLNESEVLHCFGDYWLFKHQFRNLGCQSGILFPIPNRN